MEKNIFHIVERLKELKGFKTDGEAAAALKMSLGALSNHKTRRSIPYETLSTYCDEEGISLDWLLTGVGRKRLLDEDRLEFSPEIERVILIRLFRLLNGLAQEDIAALYGVKQRNVTGIESQRVRLRSDLVNSISQAFFISPQYYHFGEPPIFLSDVVFFTPSLRQGREMEIITTLLRQFKEEYKITSAFLVNENVIVFNINGQGVFILTNVAKQIVLRIKTPDISFKTISIDIELTENDIERIYNFPFPKEKVSEFIKLFFSVAAPELIFNPHDFKKLIEESKKFIIKKVKYNKILEIFETMESYKINLQDLKSFDPNSIYEGKEFHGYPPLDEKEWKG